MIDLIYHLNLSFKKRNKHLQTREHNLNAIAFSFNVNRDSRTAVRYFDFSSRDGATLNFQKIENKNICLFFEFLRFYFISF